ncbi:MAG: PDC sensor domain-containing protein [Thermodesulfovibrionales bacterium]
MKKTVRSILCFLLLSMPAMAAELPPVLSELEKAVTAEFNKVDQDVAKLAGRLREENDLRTAVTRRMLGDLCRSYPYAVDCATVDREGRMLVISPREYAKFEGVDISSQEQMVRLRESGKPVMSNVFRAAEGFEAVDLEHPVFTSTGEFAGSVSMLINPDALFSFVLTPALKGMPVEAFAMQKDGRILYDADKEEIGRMLFDDPLYKPYPRLIAVGAMAVKEKTGSGSYEFSQQGSEKVVKKDAFWTTVGLHGIEWRLVVMHVTAGQAVSPGKGSANQNALRLDDALRGLAIRAEVKQALSAGDAAGVRKIFTGFYADHGGLYSVQWLDSRGTNRYGYPEENSLINFDMTTLKTESSKPMLRALSTQKESSFDAPLVEGKTGIFFMVPVHEGEKYLGMIYTIRLKD